MSNKTYITYDNKSSALDLSSVYVISDKDANEIKTVVNNLVDKLAGERASFDKIFKYAQINIPTAFDSNKSYDLIVQFSSALTFDEILHEISVKNNSDKFYIFNGSSGYGSVSGPFSSASFGKDVLVSLEGYVNSDTNTYIRYKFVNANNENDGTEWRSFALGTNDFQIYPEPPADEIPIVVTINKSDVTSALIDRSKIFLTNNPVFPITLFTNLSDVSISNISTYFKYEASNELKTNHSYSYSYGSSFPTVQDGDVVVAEISGTVSGKTGVYRYAYGKNRLKNTIAALSAITAGSSTPFSLYQTTKYGGDVSFTPSASVTTGASINASSKTISCSSDVSKTIYATIDKKTYPVSVLANDTKWLSAYFGTSSKSVTCSSNATNNFNLKEIRFDNASADVAVASMASFILNKDAKTTISVTVNSSTKAISVSNIGVSKDYKVMFVYTKNGSKMFDILTVKTSYTPPLEAPKPTFLHLSDAVNPDGESQTYSLIIPYLYFENSSPVKATPTTYEHGEYVSEYGAPPAGQLAYWLDSPQNTSHYPVKDMIRAKCISGDQTFYDYVTVDHQNAKYIQKLLISCNGNDNRTSLTVGSGYVLGASAVFSDSTIEDVTAYTTFSVYKPKHDTINVENSVKRLMVANAGQSRLIVINASANGFIGESCFYAEKVVVQSEPRVIHISADSGGGDGEGGFADLWVHDYAGDYVESTTIERFDLPVFIQEYTGHCIAYNKFERNGETVGRWEIYTDVTYTNLKFYFDYDGGELGEAYFSRFDDAGGPALIFPQILVEISGDYVEPIDEHD